ncbi:MAG: hypothetical protein Q7O66_05100, partial [Dehalococcoidia bacterium]|nr:hypothetical protein [Dehalococcoidia bacterium]
LCCELSMPGLLGRGSFDSTMGFFLSQFSVIDHGCVGGDVVVADRVCDIIKLVTQHNTAWWHARQV